MVLEKLREILCSEFDADELEVVPEANLMFDLNMDSLDLAELGMSIEDVFEVELPFEDEDLEKIKTVGDLVKYLEENK